MDTIQICPGCKKALPADVPLRLCPECLIRSGFKTGTEPGGVAVGFVPPPLEEIAASLSQFEIIELIGQGGMGAVYKARQTGLDRFVALKILPPKIAAEPGFAERFNREARALARLNHPHIVAVHDFGRAGGLHYLVMEFVDGTNLRQLQRSGQVTPEQALAIVPQICEALQFAHGEGVVHRDIKPENILIDKRGRVKITDFGIAKILGQAPERVGLTGAQDVVGTPHYMAPEQIEKPQTVDHRADIYSLGVVFYEILTGELPLGKFAPPSRKVQVDVRLDEVVLRALEKEPERRYQHAGDMKTDVETIITHPGAERRKAQPPIVGRTPNRDLARRRLKGPAVGLIVTGVVNLLAAWFVTILVAGSALAVHSGIDLDGMANYLPELLHDPGYGTMRWLVGVTLILWSGLSGFALLGGIRLWRFQERRIGIASGIVAILLAPCGLIGLPVGIWTLLALNDEEVRAAFGKANGRSFAGRKAIIRSVAFATLPLIVVLSISAMRGRQSGDPAPEAAQRLQELSAVKAVQTSRANVAPVVVQSIPESGANGVDPALGEIRVTFSKTMRRDAWSWAVWQKEHFPAINGKARYLSDGRTCVLPVRLEPGKVYAVWINSEQASNFTDQSGNPALPYLLIFETRK